MRKPLFILLAILILQGFFTAKVSAATRTWDGGGGADTNWSTCANWDGPDTCPTSSDIATFNTTSTNNSTIDAGFAGSVAGISIASGYTGTITQARTLTVGASNFSQADGTFTGSADTITINGSFTQTGGVFTSTSGTLSIQVNMTLTAGTFNSNSGTVDFMDTSNSQSSILTCSGTSFNKITITKNNYPSGNVTVSSGCTVPLGADPTITMSAGTFTNNGTVTVASGTLTQTSVGGSTNFVNNGTFTHSGNGWNFQGGFANGASGVVTYSGTTAAFGYNLDVSLGTFPSGLTVTFQDIINSQSSTITCGSVTFTKIIVTKDYFPSGSFTVSSDCTVPLGADPTIAMSGTFTNNGTVTIASGTLTQTSNGNFTNNGTFTHSGNGWNFQGGFTNGSSGVVTYSGSTISIRGTFSIGSGTFPNGKDITFTDTGGVATGALSCGSVALSSLTINKSSGGTLTPSSSCTVTGAITHSAGTVANPSSAYTWITQGNFAKTAATTIGGANLTLSLEGSSDTTVSHSAGTFASKIQVNKSGGARASLSSALTTSGQTCTVVEGVFDVNAFGFTCGSTFTVEDGGTLMLVGSETLTSPTLNSGSTVDYKGDGDGLTDSLTLKNYSYHHLTINSTDGASDTFSLPATIDVNGNLTITAGTLDATVTPYNMTVGGNWDNSGTFTARTGTVTLDGTSQSILGSTTFYNLTKSISSADTLTFANNGTQTITGTMTLGGQSGSLLSLVSNSSGNQWEIDPQGTRTISYLDVEDSNNTNATDIVVTGFNITNGGNNTGWAFNSAPDTPTTLGGASYVDGSTGSDSTPTLSFTLSDSDGADTVKFKIEIDDSADFASLVVDYTSALAAQGSTSFTVGQAVGSGTYTTGSAGQTLSDGSYYWRVKAEDNSASTSSYATANSGAVAFAIDTTVPASSSGSSGSSRALRRALDLFTFGRNTDAPNPVVALPAIENSRAPRAEREDSPQTPVVETPTPNAEDIETTPEAPLVEDSPEQREQPQDSRNASGSVGRVLASSWRVVKKMVGVVVGAAIVVTQNAMVALPIIGLTTAGVVLATQVVTYSSFFSILNLRRTWFDTLSLAGLRKRSRPWGTVYDSDTKQPLNPVLVVLKDLSGREVASAVTDVDGRYGLIAPPGEYVLELKKENYSFPSKKLQNTEKDILYDNLYFGTPIKVTEDNAVINQDIPMDQEKFDWNQYRRAQEGGMYFFSRHEVLWAHFSNILFNIGFVASLIMLVLEPTTYSVIIFTMQLIFSVLRKLGKPQKFGIVKSKDGQPIQFALVRALHPDANLEIRRTVTDEHGRYYCLVPPGEYRLLVESRNPDGSYSPIFHTEKLRSRHGYIGRQVEV